MTLAALLLGGCATVTSRQFVGGEPVALEARLWNGAWTDDHDLVIHVRVKDAANGVLEAAVVPGGLVAAGGW